MESTVDRLSLRLGKKDPDARLKEKQDNRMELAKNEDAFDLVLIMELQRLATVIENSSVIQGPPGPPGKGLKGDPGRNTNTLLKGDKGDKGDMPTVAEIVKALKPHIPAAIPGAPGKDGGKAPTLDQVVAAIMPDLRKVLANIKGEPGKPGQDAVITDEMIIKAFERKGIDAKYIKNIPTVVRELPQFIFGGGTGGGARLSVLDEGVAQGVDIRKIDFRGDGVAVSRTGENGIVVTVAAGSPSTGSTVYTEPIVGIQNGSNVDFDLSALPHALVAFQWIARNGKIQTNRTGVDGYTIAGNTLTVYEADAGEEFIISWTSNA